MYPPRRYTRSYQTGKEHRQDRVGVHVDRIQRLLSRFNQLAASPVRPLVLRDWALFFIWGITILLFYNTYSFQNFTIPTGSMENTLLVGDHITVNKFVYGKAQWPWEEHFLPNHEIRRGEVLVHKWPGDPRQHWIKRCIALPGDHFEIANDKLFINGKAQEEGYAFFKDMDGAQANARDPGNNYLPVDYNRLKPGVAHAAERPNENVGVANLIAKTRQRILANFDVEDPHTKALLRNLEEAEPGIIPESFYLVMGDNRNYSSDSRDWGLLPASLVKGRAYVVWWSYGADLNTHELNGRDLILSYLRIPSEFWTRTHWGKCFRLIR